MALIKILRWVARIVGTLLLGVFIVFSSAEGLPNPLDLTPTELFLSIAIIIMLLGTIAGWKWDAVGGLAIMAGVALFLIVEHTVFSGPIFPIFPFVGLAYLICWLVPRKLRTANSG